MNFRVVQNRLSVLIGVMASVLSAFAAGVQSAQTVTLRPGWNAFYLEVAPEESPDELFADWPVRSVSAYDQSAFLETRQYSGGESTEGTRPTGYLVWRRGADAGLTSMIGLGANTVYLAFNTNAVGAAVFTTTVYGRPRAPRVSWHPSSDGDAQNLVGLSLVGGVASGVGEYFDGLNGTGDSFHAYRIWGSDELKPSLSEVFPSEPLSNGQVLAMTSTKVSDWSGVIRVSPVGGVDFGKTESLAFVDLKNESSRPRTVRLSLAAGSARKLIEVPPVPTGLMIRTTSDGEWCEFTPSAPQTVELDADETCRVALALDRTKLNGPADLRYGAVLSVSDDTPGGSGFRASVPVEATGDGGASAESAWPKGIWLATAELDTVTFIGPPEVETNRDDVVIGVFTNAVTGLPEVMTNVYERPVIVSPQSEVAAGGRMKVRLPMYVAGDGTMTLLQRFWYGRDTEGRLHVISGSEASDVPLVGHQRVSTAFLPTDQVKIPAGSGAFGATATFPFVVSETSNVNPMRHALHPQHDGKGFDFRTPSPSGDDLANYALTVKPESFSITNTVNFAWDPSQGAAWNPAETLGGTLIWEFGGLRHEGTVRARGRFAMKRISSATLEK